MKRLSFLLVIGALALGIAQSKAGEVDGTYFCSSEIEAGLKYDPSLKEWRAARFKEKEKFILKVRFVKAEKKGGLGMDGGTEIYNLTITPEGTNLGENCYAKRFSHRGDPREIEGYADHKILFCYTALIDYTFNLKTNRFLSADIHGYVNGDNNDDSPTFAAGKCTSVN